MRNRNAVPTIMTGLSAKDRLNKLWEELERKREEQMIHHDSGRVSMGHEYLRQVRS